MVDNLIGLSMALYSLIMKQSMERFEQPWDQGIMLLPQGTAGNLQDAPSSMCKTSVICQGLLHCMLQPCSQLQAVAPNQSARHIEPFVLRQPPSVAQGRAVHSKNTLQKAARDELQVALASRPLTEM